MYLYKHVHIVATSLNPTGVLYNLLGGRILHIRIWFSIYTDRIQYYWLNPTVRSTYHQLSSWRMYRCPQRFPALPISGAAELRLSRLKDSDQIEHYLLVLDSANLLAYHPCKPLKYLLHRKRFPFLPSHIILTNKPIPAQLSVLHQIMYRLTGDPHIHLNHAAGISSSRCMVIFAQLSNQMVQNVQSSSYSTRQGVRFLQSSTAKYL